MDQKFQYVQIRTRQFTDNTCPDLEVPRRARKKPDDEADALAVQRPVLLRPTGPTLPWQAWLSISIHKEPALLCVSCSISARAFSNSSLPYPCSMGMGIPSSPMQWTAEICAPWSSF